MFELRSLKVTSLVCFPFIPSPLFYIFFCLFCFLLFILKYCVFCLSSSCSAMGVTAFPGLPGAFKWVIQSKPSLVSLKKERKKKPESMYRNSEPLMVNAGHAIVYFFFVCVGLYLTLGNNMSFVNRLPLFKKKKKRGTNPAATVCLYCGNVTAGFTVCGWDYLRSISVTLIALQRYSVCFYVWSGGWEGGLGDGVWSVCKTLIEDVFQFLLLLLYS